MQFSPNLNHKFDAILIKTATGFFKKYMIQANSKIYFKKKKRAKGQKILKNHVSDRFSLSGIKNYKLQ